MSEPIRKLPNPLTSRAKELRRNSTDAENALWRLLRDRRLLGIKFRRQHPLGPFILDFYCFDHRLAVEADGDHHADEDVLAYDERRTRYLLDEGITVLRFSNREILTERDGVLSIIAQALGIPSP
jgi:very-short-patch-repair endonuclease